MGGGLTMGGVLAAALGPGWGLPPPRLPQLPQRSVAILNP